MFLLATFSLFSSNTWNIPAPIIIYTRRSNANSKNRALSSFIKKHEKLDVLWCFWTDSRTDRESECLVGNLDVWACREPVVDEPQFSGAECLLVHGQQHFNESGIPFLLWVSRDGSCFAAGLLSGTVRCEVLLEFILLSGVVGAVTPMVDVFLTITGLELLKLVFGSLYSSTVHTGMGSLWPNHTRPFSPVPSPSQARATSASVATPNEGQVSLEQLSGVCQITLQLSICSLWFKKYDEIFLNTVCYNFNFGPYPSCSRLAASRLQLYYSCFILER